MSAMSQTTPEAWSRWERIPTLNKSYILSHIWCPQCMRGKSADITMMFMQHENLIIQGTCKKCGGKVVRLVEPD